MIESVRGRIARAASAPFRHVEYPLANSFDYMGDPGLHGPGSVSWAVIGDIATIVGGIRGLLIQAAHPEVVAGVGDHSRYREDPLGRLSRTSAYVTATTYGAMPEVTKAIEKVDRIHRRVNGVSERGIAYDASDPGFSAWVHNALTDSFLVVNQAFGANPLSSPEADLFVAEQTRVGALLNSDPMPMTAHGLHEWIAGHPDIASSQAMTEAVEFLANPPLDRSIRPAYRIMLEAAVATIPIRIRRILGLRARRGAVAVGRATIAGLRWAMGFSPTWQVALIRTSSPIPEGVFKQDIPIEPPKSI